VFSVSMLLAYVRRVFFLLLQRACESWLGPGGQGWGCWGMEGGGVVIVVGSEYGCSG